MEPGAWGMGGTGNSGKEQITLPAPTCRGIKTNYTNPEYSGRIKIDYADWVNG